MAPHRPILYRDQIGLAVITVVVFAVGIYVVARLVIG